MTRIYPETPAGPFDPPPAVFTDAENRQIEIQTYDDGSIEPFVTMYLAFEPADRAQGIPPTNEPRIREWLEQILIDESVNVYATYDGGVIGHATLVPDGNDAYELAIFVLRAYQQSGIGTRLIYCLLGAGQARGVERVWLSVERWNAAARALYRNVGFEPTDADGFEFEMSLRLSATQ